MMKKAIILHGWEGDHTLHWYPWLKKQLEELRYEAWVPDLPGADYPSVVRYTDFLLGKSWDFANNLIIGHSAGAIEVLGLLQSLPHDVNVNTAVLVSSFTGEVPKGSDYDHLKDLFEVPFDFELIRSKANQFIFVHGDNDAFCPLDQAQYLADQVHGDMNVIANGQHFITDNDPKWREFPELLRILKKKEIQ